MAASAAASAAAAACLSTEMASLPTTRPAKTRCPGFGRASARSAAGSGLGRLPLSPLAEQLPFEAVTAAWLSPRASSLPWPSARGTGVVADPAANQCRSRPSWVAPPADVATGVPTAALELAANTIVPGRGAVPDAAVGGDGRGPTAPASSPEALEAPDPQRRRPVVAGGETAGPADKVSAKADSASSSTFPIEASARVPLGVPDSTVSRARDKIQNGKR